ncbi:hypothetical protein GCM10009560_40890 [Nonomuraea longicatena]|uniref:Uncharacterized protein n=1 Tax=Nonomuraea longicatena TaxID=83682 RepID=A0ABN1PWK3_9ACTN
MLVASGLRGIAIRPDRNEPIAHDTEPMRTTTMPMVLPLSPPVSDSPAIPARPTSTPATVSGLGRSRRANLNTTSHSGTEATSSAASPVEMYCWATASRPLPVLSSRTPMAAAPTSSRRVIRSAEGPERMSRKAPSSVAAVMKRMAPLSMGGMDSMATAMPM